MVGPLARSDFRYQQWRICCMITDFDTIYTEISEEDLISNSCP